jgi:6-phosphofructokinase 1
MKKIAVFTSGGDAPGMNACIRAVVRTALHYNLEVLGVRRGYAGMVDGEFIPMNSRSVSNIIQKGGTILQSARSEAFRTPEGRLQAYENLQKRGISGVVAIGGDGTFTGADVFCNEYPDIPFVGVPGTIDNDLYGTDYTIGYDTAINTAMEAIDKVKDTADAHNRFFFIEVMGRDAGFISMYS